jgi:hypothetical protein
MVNKHTVKSLEGNFGHEFVYSELISVKGKKYMMAIDNYGFVNYFFTRNYKQFAFSERYYIGGLMNVTEDQINEDNKNNVITDI